MYSFWAYALAQVTIEVPYLFIQALVFEMITYPMIGYYGSTYKILWYFYAVFCTQLYFTIFGMLFVSLTPEVTIAGALLSAFHPLLSLFSGFLIPPLKIPRWWTWMYYLMPISWTLNCLLTSQYGDVTDEVMVFGESMTMDSLLETYFRFRHDRFQVMVFGESMTMDILIFLNTNAAKKLSLAAFVFTNAARKPFFSGVCKGKHYKKSLKIWICYGVFCPKTT